MRYPIETAPKDGTEFLARKKGGEWFITAYRPEWVDGSGFGIVDSCCGYHEDMDPVEWHPLPPLPKDE